MILHRGVGGVWHEIRPDGITTYATDRGNHDGRRYFEGHMTLEQFGKLAQAVSSILPAPAPPTIEQVVAAAPAKIDAQTKRLDALEAMSDEKLDRVAAKMDVKVDKELTDWHRRAALILAIDAASPEDSPLVEEPDEDYDPEAEDDDPLAAMKSYQSGGEQVSDGPGLNHPAPSAENKPTEDLPAGDALGLAEPSPAGGTPMVPRFLPSEDDKAQAAADIQAAKPENEIHESDSEK